MLPSARVGMSSASLPPGATEGSIGEGRPSRSRSNSIESVTDELDILGKRHASVDSDDDDGASSATRRAGGFQWVQNQTRNSFGLGENSEFSLFPSRRSETNNIFAPGTHFASALTLPSKVYRGSGAFGAFAVQSGPPGETSGASGVAYPSPPIGNDDHATTGSHGPIPPLSTSTLSGVSHQAETQTQSSDQPGHTAKHISPIVPYSDSAAQESVATNQSLATIPPNQTSTGSSSEAEQAEQIQNTTEIVSSHTSSSRQPIPFSIHNFFASAPLSYPGIPGDVSRKSSANDVPPKNVTRETTPPVRPRGSSSSSVALAQTPNDDASVISENTESPQADAPTHKKRRLRSDTKINQGIWRVPVQQRNDNSSTASAQTPDVDAGIVSENTESKSPQADAPTPSKRRLRIDTKRKRGTWRINMQSASSALTPELERPLSTLPGKPLFSTAEPVPLGPTPLPYFEYRESRDRTKRSAVKQAAQRDAASENVVAPTHDDNGPADHQNFDDYGDDGLDTAYSFDVDTDVSTCAGDRAPDHPPSGLSSYPSLQSVGQASSRSPERGKIAMRGSARPDGVTGANDRSIASISDGPTPALSGNHLVSIIIEDRRWDNAEPSLVELSLPLRPDSSGGFWLDAVDLCKALQSGPSRIDGPAKAYTYRGRFRQYFLRVSAENFDNFVPANIVVPADLFLRTIVEPMIPSSNRQTTEATSHLVLPRPPGTSTQLASPALSEERLPMLLSRGPSQAQPPKRGRDQTISTASGSRTRSNAPLRTENATGAAPDVAPSSSYYRKRAL